VQSRLAAFADEAGLSTSLIARKPHQEMPEFDITAMVDLVFMMNIYFLVTFVTMALSELPLPSAAHVGPLDADTAVVLTLLSTLDGNSIHLYLGDGKKGESIEGADQQEQRVRAAVAQGAANGKTAVLLKAEKKVRLGQLFRIASAASHDGVKLHVAVLEKETR
jgi:biopolymer transport protein ExbD